MEFDACAFEDLAWWVEHDRKQALRILKLIREIERTPFDGRGQPEPLKHELSGCWSRRIDREHRLVYQVDGEGKIRILACRYHYQGPMLIAEDRGFVAVISPVGS